ncbi:hypothetical protein LE190_19640 [Massilia oculi]|uniref:DUF2987 domain-containing protein n=1 Tax=Massilia hydrophila TaxID=3044279 RepID=A0ABS7YIG1_9BURK|nr:hypothetical protein [Massilia oculi]MCA1858125.1 hypothetical protein [Massilia oculi]
MMRFAHVTTCVCFLATAGLAAAQAHAQVQGVDWASYRDAYRAVVVFEKYGGAKTLLQNHLQLLPREKGVLGEGVQLILKGKTVQTSLAFDALGRGVLPLIKTAYDENAVLAPNRPIGPFALRARVSIATQADNTYDAAELRAACEQALDFARHTDAGARSRQCVGVRLVFPKKGTDTTVKLRRPDAEAALPVTQGAAFAGDADADFPVVNYRFGNERAQLVTYSAPLAIVPLFE